MASVEARPSARVHHLGKILIQSTAAAREPQSAEFLRRAAAGCRLAFEFAHLWYLRPAHAAQLWRWGESRLWLQLASDGSTPANVQQPEGIGDRCSGGQTSIACLGAGRLGVELASRSGRVSGTPALASALAKTTRTGSL